MARVAAKAPVKVGDKLTFAVSIEDMKFFDEATGLAIRGYGRARSARGGVVS